MEPVQNPAEHKSIETPFDMICQAAREKDPEKLAAALLLASIDVVHEKNPGTPVTQLALENDKASVDFLLGFHASLHWVGFGHALGGRAEEVYVLLKDARTQTSDLLTLAVFGFAWQGNKIELDKLLECEQVKGNPSKAVTVLASMLEGFGYGGYAAEAYALLDREWVKKDPDRIFALLPHLANGFARGGYTRQALKLLKRKGVRENPARISLILKNMAYGFARHGDRVKIVSFLHWMYKKHPDKVDAILAEMLYGLARGRHISEADKLFERVKKNHPDRVEYMRNRMAYGFAHGGHTAETYTLLLSLKELLPLKDSDCIFKMLKEIVRGFAEGGHPQEAGALLNFVKRNYPDQLSYALLYVTYYLAVKGYKKEAYAWLDKIRQENPVHLTFVFNTLAYSCIKTRYEPEAFDLLELDMVMKDPAQLADVLKYMARGFISGNNKTGAYALLDRIEKNYPDQFIPVLKVIAIAENEKKECIDKAVVLKRLTMMKDPALRHQLARELKGSVSAYDTLSLVSEAENFDRVMEKKDITYGQLLGWTDLSVRIFILQCIPLFLQNVKGASCLCIKIMTFLLPVTSTEAVDLCNKVSYQASPARFFKNLAKYAVLVTEQPAKHLKYKKS